MNKPEVFQRHLSTLQFYIPDTPRVFICPICMNIFPESDLYPDSDDQKPKLTDGHVWNEQYVKEFSNENTHKMIFSQRVILCDLCNSSSGGKNEGVLIDFKNFRQVNQAGDYVTPSVRVDFGDDSVELERVNFRFDKVKNKPILNFPVGANGQRLYNPQDRIDYNNLLSKKRCGLLCYRVQEKWLTSKKWQKAQAALITSAYLQLFHKFGYSYVFNANSAPVRKYILKSFEGWINTELDPSPEKHISVGMCGHGHYNPEPKIAISPPDGNRFQILEVNFMDYHMRLPFPADYIEESELCEECGEETGEVNKNIVLDAPDDEIVDTVRDKLEAYR